MIEKVRSSMQTSETRFLQKSKEITMFYKLRNTAIRESLNVELLLLLRYFNHINRMSQERLRTQTLYAKLLAV